MAFTYRPPVGLALRLSEIAKEQGYHSRSDLITAVLQAWVANRDQMLGKRA